MYIATEFRNFDRFVNIKNEGLRSALKSVHFNPAGRLKAARAIQLFRASPGFA